MVGTILKLIIEDDEGKTTVFPLSEFDVSIGRKEGNTIRLLERNVSRRHARLTRTNGAVYIEDLDSYNGVKINGERICGRYALNEGDLVEIGDYHLALQRAESPESVSEETAPSAASESDSWPQQGTVPDFRLPEQVLGGPGNVEPTVSPHNFADRPTTEMSGAPTAAAVQEVADEGQTTPDRSPASVTPLHANGGTPGAEAQSGLTVGPATHSTVPRLVCVSTGYAGREFALTRPELVVGRVEDNDIVIEHRSVSRNHAKIVYDGRTHKIIDLQSANGILVNGEEYAMTDLRRGDLIELGHVRFRFIPAQEPFYPMPDEARAMEDAGVAPPPPADAMNEAGGSEAATREVSLSGYDPSTAATVTDTPLDAIGMGDIVPSAMSEVSETDGSASNGGLSERGTAPDPLSDRPGAFAGFDRLSEEPRTRREAFEAETLGPRRSLLPLVVVGLAAIALVLLGMLILDDTPDDKVETLRTYAEEGRPDEVIEFFNTHRAELEGSTEARELYLEARRGSGMIVQDDGSPSPEEPVPDEVVVEPVEPPPPPPTPEDQIEEEAAAPEDEAVPSSVTPNAATPEPAPFVAASKKIKPRRRPVSKRQRAKEKYERAFAHLTFNRTKRAIEELDDCLKVDERYADCHRLLGSTWAEQNDSARAVKHYRRYLQLAPKAQDASKIREWIEIFESEQ